MVASDLGLHRFTLVARLGFLVVCSCVHGERGKDHRGLSQSSCSLEVKPAQNSCPRDPF